MEPPTSLDADAIRDEKLKVLRALRPIDAGNAAAAGRAAASTATAPPKAARCRGYVD
jgi:glucose-6-phosphate 1-dehydrogenase